eukprot:3566571-Rhodomonas_salina.1
MQVASVALELNLPVHHPCVVSLQDAWMVAGRIHLCAAYRAVVSERWGMLLEVARWMKDANCLLESGSTRACVAERVQDLR